MLDVLVCGAGPAGATVSALLSKGGMNVAVVDPMTRKTERLELVAPSTVRLFDAVGGNLLEDSSLASFCPGIQRNWGGEISVDEFICHRGGKGYVVDRRRLDVALRGISRKAGARLICGRVVAVEREGTTFRVRLRQAAKDMTVLAKTVVDASGRTAALTRRLGARRVLHEAMLARLTEASAYGAPGYLIVESHPGTHWGYRVVGPNQREEVWEVFSKRDRVASKNPVVDASSVFTFPSAGRGWAAIGDAAASFDPLCSQGIANALSTALAIAGAVVSDAGLGEPAAHAYSEAVLRTFEYAERGRRLSYSTLPDRTLRYSKTFARSAAHSWDPTPGIPAF